MSTSTSVSKLTSNVLLPEFFQKLFSKGWKLLNAINRNRLNKIILTVSIGAIGLSIAANYYFRLLSIRKKRILNRSQQLIETVTKSKNSIENG